MVDDKKKAEKKLFDENDEAFCGFCSIQTLDQDGIAGRTLGSHVKAPLHIVSARGADIVVMEAVFLAANPLFYLELRNEEQFYLWGRWWLDGPKHSETNELCSLVPVAMTDCKKQMDKNGSQSFQGSAICEALRHSSTRPLQVDFTSEEKKFKTKLTKVTLTVPREAWTEFKHRRARVWKASKLGMPSGGGGDDEDKKKDDDKKDE